MTVDFSRFGDPDKFEIAVRARDNDEPRNRWPADYGWSLGDLRIRVAGRTVTSNRCGARERSFVSWYLLPVFQWLADHWVELLHEEEYGWIERSLAPGAIAAPRQLNATIGAPDPRGRAQYAEAQAWRRRHALRVAAHGGLFPDLYLRRYLDGIEISWTDAPPAHAPDDFRLTVQPGVLNLPVADVAVPLWDAMAWAAAGNLGAAESDRDNAALTVLRESMATLRRLSVVDLARGLVAAPLLERAGAALAKAGAADALGGDLVAGAPAVASFSPAVAMFGGVTPDLTDNDVAALATVVAARHGGAEPPELDDLIDNLGGAPQRAAYLEGYTLAETLLATVTERGLSGPADQWIDVEAIVSSLGIDVRWVELETDSIRGVALAGRGIGPTIVVNLTSPYNRGDGRRFTLAHELCHILYDRGRARQVGITSGPWAPVAVERRANAFAAMLMMPRTRVLHALRGSDARRLESKVRTAAKRLHVNAIALVEHLYNLALLSEIERDRLRTSFAH